MGGWQVGASIRRGVKWQWLGWTGSYGSRSNDDVRVRDALGGVSATSPWLLGGEGLVRAFGQALGGYAWSQTALGLHDSAPMFVAGGGFDIFFFPGFRWTTSEPSLPASMRTMVEVFSAKWRRSASPTAGQSGRTAFLFSAHGANLGDNPSFLKRGAARCQP